MLEVVVRMAPGTAAASAAAGGPVLTPLFAAPVAAAPPRWLRAAAPPAEAAALAAALREREGVEAAYVKPATRLPGGPGPPPGDVPDLMPRQGYLDPAPAGIDARAAWARPGGDGAGVRIVDVEGAWRFTHRDLRGQDGVLDGVESRSREWRSHGTAVAGVLCGAADGAGITGICPAARLAAVSFLLADGSESSAPAIRRAAAVLAPGDVLLLEMHRPGGPGGALIPVEWWPDDHAAILEATARGVVVVAAAGNGAADLDDPGYDAPDEGFPAEWTNPLRRGAADSGAILVGAGAPPERTHGRNVWGPDRSRLIFSNHGSAVDAQGWGQEVTTLGYGDLHRGGGEDEWYTDRFSGTSSAAPIVAGAVACLQGMRREAGAPPLTPAEVRARLRDGGSAQQDAPHRPASQRIGARPDLAALSASPWSD
jgi:subtilisin family serine protease